MRWVPQTKGFLIAVHKVCKGKVLASLIDMIDLSLLESLSSMAMTTQLAMIVMMMTHSKGGQLTSQVISLRTGLVGVKRKREVGPRSSGSSFFFFPISPLCAPGPAVESVIKISSCGSSSVLSLACLYDDHEQSKTNNKKNHTQTELYTELLRS